MNNSKLIIGLALAALLLGGIGWKYYEYQNPSVVADLEQKQEEKKVQEKATATVDQPTAPEKATEVIQVPDVPVNGTMKGVIEVGASGFNSFVVNIDKNKNWELVSKQFGSSLAYEGFITETDVKIGLKNYIGDIARKGVMGKNIQFVMSSGAAKNPKTKLIADALRSDGYVVNQVTADQEGKYALRAALPKVYKNTSFVCDMGSGNTKISWYEDNGSLKSIELPGAKYYQIPLTDDDVMAKVKDAAMKVPVARRTSCFIIGGIPYDLAKQARNGEERFTILKSPDTYSAGDDVKMKSGLVIYRTLYETTGTSTFVFDWDANFTIGFLLSMN